MMRPISRRHIISYLLVGSVAGILSSCRTNTVFGFVAQNKGTDEIEILHESGDLLEEIERLKQLAVPKNSNRYRPPTAHELQQFGILAKAFISQDLQTVSKHAKSLKYELVRFIDRSTQQIFYGLREQYQQADQIRGWGSYFINTSYRTNALIEIPHVIFDRHSSDIGARVFLEASARGLLMAGAHRHANGTNTADVCNPIQSIFQEVHKAWISSKHTKTWQIHGFSLVDKPDFPENTESVLSNGQGQAPWEVIDLNHRMRASGFPSYVYNRLPESSWLNQQVNQGVPGHVFAPLGATENVQGRYCNRLNAVFVHIELGQTIRDRHDARIQVANILAHSIQATT